MSSSLIPSTRQWLLLASLTLSLAAQPDPLVTGFNHPPHDSHPETWFHLIGGNVSKPGLDADLAAVAGAGFSGLQLFHGRGGAWPGVTPQIQTLSPSWDGMITHVADEARRLGLRYTMQNCPGWAMSGGPWITPDRAMRHLIWSRTDVTGGALLSLALPKPEPSADVWRDYRDVAVLAFPTPKDDLNQNLTPTSIRSNRPTQPWQELFAGGPGSKSTVRLEPGEDPAWLEVNFDQVVTLRSVALPPIEHLSLRRIFDPQISIRIQAITPAGLIDVTRRAVPRSTWQDKDWDERPWVIALPDVPASGYRLTFENKYPMGLNYLQLSTAARVQDYQGQAGYVLRSLDLSPPASQNPATWIDPAAVIDLSAQLDAHGVLHWTPPPGDWTVVRFGHVNTGVTNKPAPPEATGFECDKLSPLGAEQHFAGYIGRISAPGGPADGGRLQGMVIDSWECFTQTWTPAMEQEFASRRGYALRHFLPALAGWVVGSQSQSTRFLRDWRATLGDLMVENYYGRLASLARARGMTLSFESSTGDVAIGDLLQYYDRADIPMGEFWQPNDPHWGGLEQKPIAPAVSAGHVYGKTIIAAEAFTNVGIRWDEHPFMLKHMADFNFTLGLNHLVFHTTTHNPRLDLVPGTSFGSRIGTPFIRGQTWYPQLPLFTEYLARCQFLLQQGLPVADVLWYLGDAINHRPRSDAPFPSGYKFDYVNQDVLLNRLTVTNGHLRSPESVQWRVLWLRPEDCRLLTVPTLLRLRELLHAGATVIGPAPVENASLSGGPDADRQFHNLVAELWGRPDQPTGDRTVGAGRLVWGQDLAATLQQLGIPADVRGASAATWCHRQDGDTEIYFVAADRLAPLQANLNFRAQGQPELWDPLTGESRPIPLFQREGTTTTVPLDLPAAGSAFVIFRPGHREPAALRLTHGSTVLMDAGDLSRVDPGAPARVQGLTLDEELQPWVNNPLTPAALTADGQHLLAWQAGPYTVTRGNGSVLTVTATKTKTLPLLSAWTLGFPPGWDAPADVDLPRLIPWSELADIAVASFSGTASYRHTFELPPTEPATRLLLDLGRVGDIAEIYINDKPVTTLWGPPFRTDITAFVKAGPNRLEIRVTNTWHNRLAYDASLPEAKRRTWTINGPTADSPLKPAGLVGPVTIQVGEEIRLP